MKYLPRAIALIALTALIVAPDVYTTGLRQGGMRPMPRDIWHTGLPADSDYIRALYARPMGTDVEAVLGEGLLLSKAGQRQQAELLQKYFAYCGVLRFIGEDAGCSGQTVRSAVDKASKLSLSPWDQWPIGNDLESKLTDAVSLSLANEQILRQSTDQTTWSTLTYEGPGILGYDGQVKGAYVLLAAHNRSAWGIENLVVRLELPIPLECSSWVVPFPFFSPRVLQPHSDAILYCALPRSAPLDDLLVAVEALQHQGSLPIHVEEFTLKDPPVVVADSGNAPFPRFTAHLVRDLPIVGYAGTRPQSVGAVIDHELAGVTCSQLATCPSLFESASVALFHFFGNAPALLPIIVGLLMGLCIGGFSRRTLVFGSVVVALVLLCTVGGFAYLFHQISMSKDPETQGFGMLGMVKLTGLSGVVFLLWFPAMLVGIQITKPLRAISERRA